MLASRVCRSRFTGFRGTDRFTAIYLTKPKSATGRQPAPPDQTLRGISVQIELAA